VQSKALCQRLQSRGVLQSCRFTSFEERGFDATILQAQSVMTGHMDNLSARKGELAFLLQESAVFLPSGKKNGKKGGVCNSCYGQTASLKHRDCLPPPPPRPNHEVGQPFENPQMMAKAPPTLAIYRKHCGQRKSESVNLIKAKKTKMLWISELKILYTKRKITLWTMEKRSLWTWLSKTPLCAFLLLCGPSAAPCWVTEAPGTGTRSPFSLF
jgi:hypothetical protein